MHAKTSEGVKPAANTETAKVQSTQEQEEVGSALLRLLSRRPSTSLVAELDHALRTYYVEKAKDS